MNKSVLVLNQNYEPLNICNARRAVVLVFGGKAEILETHDALITTSQDAFPYPSVIRLICLIRAPRARVKLSRREVFLRDSYTCQYCGRRTEISLWITSFPGHEAARTPGKTSRRRARACNHRKGGKSVAEARMTLKRMPFEPSPGRYYAIERRLEQCITEGWYKFLPGIESSERSTNSMPLSAD
ncbi:MAG: HNH endonuclease [Thermomicrobiales bacterium]